MKVREKTINNNINGKKYSYKMSEVTIPNEHMQFLGWKKGDKLVVSSDKNTGSITFTKIEEGKND